MSICSAHCPWVRCSKSTRRITSYSSSVSTIGSPSALPPRDKGIHLWCAADSPASWRSRHRRSLPYFRYIPIIVQDFKKSILYFPIQKSNRRHSFGSLSFPKIKMRLTAYSCQPRRFYILYGPFSRTALVVSGVFFKTTEFCRYPAYCPPPAGSAPADRPPPGRPAPHRPHPE